MKVLPVIGVAVAAIAVGFVLFTNGRDASPNSSLPDTSTSSAAVIVPFVKITEGMQSDVPRRVNYMITSSDELNKLWEMVQTTAIPPRVDFGADAVIAVFAGEKPTTGYDITVSKIEDLVSKRLVTITLMQPASGCPVAQMVTAPFEILTVPVTSLPLTHEDTVQTVGCTD